MGGGCDIVFKLLLLFFVIGQSNQCENNGFLCQGGKCLPREKVCDGFLDCDEGDDENNCAEITNCASPTWFKCKSGQCISSLLFCDGDRDCADGDDEPDQCNPDDHLENAKCHTDEFQCLDKKCINAKWACDGDPDCLDGSDETIGCEGKNTCTDGFLCKNKHCIIKEFHCDGDNDCGDFSDEVNCTTKYHSPENCPKDRGLFLCHDRSNCLENSNICDGVHHCSDGSDEKACSINTHLDETFCKNFGCSHTCHQAPNQKIICTCPQGFKLDGFMKKCIDINECEEFGFCYQKCVNTIGGFNCSCDPGYYLRSDNRSCKARGGEPLLLFSSYNQIRGIYLQSKVYFTVTTQNNRVIGVSHDGRHVYWTELNRTVASIVRSNEDGSDRTVLVNSGLKLPEDLEVDYITGNIYFTDAEQKHIGVCNKEGVCTALINEDIEKPRAIALYPQKSVMFWSDWGKTPKIATSDMDGSRHKAIVEKDLQWPNGLALDSSNERIYWVDAKILNIETVRLDGTDRRIILEGAVTHPFSISLFEDTLYWSDWENFQIEKCDKFTGKNHSSLIKEKRSPGEGENKHIIYGVHVYHPALHPRTPNPCHYHACSHLCLLSPNDTYKCACPEDFQLGSDLHTCRKTAKAFQVVVGGSQKLHFLTPRVLGKMDIFKHDLKTTVGNIEALTYDSLGGYVLISDSAKRTIFRFNIISKQISPIISSGLGKVISMSFDSYGNNLYVCDEEKLVVEVWSLTTKYSLTVYKAGRGEVPQSVVVVPEHGVFFVAVSLDGGISINRINMDGTQIVPQITGYSVRGPKVMLSYDKKSKKLFWCSSESEWIESVNLDGSDRNSLQTTRGTAITFASQNGLLMWINQDSQLLNSFDIYRDDLYKDSNQINLAADNEPLRSLTIATGLESHNLHPCQDYLKHGCSHLCLVTVNNNGVCACPLGMHLDSDNKTCLNPAHCSHVQFKCRSDDICIPRIQRCDGYVDCPSGDDEKDCEIGKCRPDQFKCTNGQCIDFKEKCDSQYDCSDHSDEADCPLLCPKDYFHCTSGECIPQSWKCDFSADCHDKSDELNCGDVTCPSDKFKCKSGTCISAGWECDGEADCIDGSDEHDKCDQKENMCKSNEFTCNNKRCLSLLLVCNGENDCGDGSDELFCTLEERKPKCGPEEFLCSKASQKCVPLRARCNGTVECPRAEDELDCADCLPHEFKCHNSKCILDTWVCDKDNDCGDNSDEDPVMCSHIKVGTVGYAKPCEEFSCKTGECLPLHLVCDGIYNCPDRSDEGPNCETACEQNPCKHICVKTTVGSRCACYAGYTLAADGYSCNDIDECAQEKCSQICFNTPGGFNCSCVDDYILKSDRMTCKAKGGRMSFILSGDDEIKKVTHNFQRTDLITFEAGAQILGLDIDSRRNRIYWSSGSLNRISALDITSGRKTFMENTDRPGKLSYDWLTGNIYYIDKASPNNIKVCSLNNRRSSLILTAPPDTSITSLVVDPISGFIFYSQGRTSALQRPVSEVLKYSFETQNSTALVSSDVSWVSGIVVDRIRRYVYWSDLYNQVIERVGFDGNQRQIVFRSQVRRPESLTFFEDSLVWLTRGSSEIKKCTLYGDHKGHCDTFPLYIYDIKFLRIMQEFYQPNMTNPCTDECDVYSVCVATAIGAKCVCEDGNVISPNELCDRSNSKNYADSRALSENARLTSSAQKPPLSGSASAVIGILMVALIICGLFAGYLYVKKRKSNVILDTMHFHNPSFGLSHLENSYHPSELVPGEHRYENPTQKLMQGNSKFGNFFQVSSNKTEKRNKAEAKDYDSDSDHYDRTDMNAVLIR